MKKEHKVREYTLRYEPFKDPHSGDIVSGMWVVVDVAGLAHPTVVGCARNLHRYILGRARDRAKDLLQAAEDVEEFLSTLTADGQEIE